MPSVDRNDGELVSVSLTDPEAFGLVFARHYRAIFGFVARRIGSLDAQDLVADTFVRAFEIRHRYDPARPSCLPWLYGIAGNLVGDRLRRVRRSERVHLVVANDLMDNEFSSAADDRVVARSVARQLNDALGRLTSRDRSTLLLYALEGLSYAEIADALNIPVGTVGSRIARARHRINELIPDLERRTNPFVRRADDVTDS